MWAALCCVHKKSLPRRNGGGKLLLRSGVRLMTIDTPLYLSRYLLSAKIMVSSASLIVSGCIGSSAYVATSTASSVDTTVVVS